MVRVLVTVEPRMYREAIALAVHRNRPEAEVMLVPEEVLDGQVKDFAPHVLVRNDSDGVVPEGLLGKVVGRYGGEVYVAVDVRFADRHYRLFWPEELEEISSPQPWWRSLVGRESRS
jgi:hypothetical protein